jgi:3-hydroxypropionyl-coenzyme A dehydratase
MRIASSNAKIGQPEVTIGIPPGWGGTQRLTRIVGPAKAKELIFSGKMITAEEAAQIGLVNKVINLTSDHKMDSESSSEASSSKSDKSNEAKLLNKKLMDECMALGRDITKNSYTAVKISKMLINKATDTDIETGLRLEIYGWALSFSHEDRHKMMSAFLNKGKK